MKLGDFFNNPASAHPVNPKPITFTVVSRDEVLPGGAANPNKRPVAASVKGALVFIGGDGALSSRVEARKALAIKYKESVPDLGDFGVEVSYQVMWRSLYEWDEQEMLLGGRLFPDVDSLRELMEVAEVNRLMKLYNEYVAEEHPDGGPKDEATFPGAKG